MADLKMKLINNNEIKLQMKPSDSLSMKFDDYQKFIEEDPIFKNSPAYKITNEDIYYWDHKSNFSGNYNDLINKPNLGIYATKAGLSEGLSLKVDKETGMGLSQNSFTTEEKNKLAGLENYDDTALLNDISDINTALDGKASISDIPTLTSDLDNDSGFITKDVDDLTYYPTNDSVNSIVALKQNIIDSENMLSADLVDDSATTNKFVTATDISTWNAKSDFSGNYSDLTGKPLVDTLWTNNSITSDFAGGQITLTGSLANYDYYEILFLMSKHETAQVSTGKVNTSYSTTLMTTKSASGVGIISRWRDANRDSNTQITFSNCTECKGGSTSVATANDRVIPYKIIGYKY